jgi:Flp pilus assembly protein TadD
MGTAFSSLGNARQAAQCFMRTLELGPEDPTVLCDLAEALCELSRFEEAAACSRVAVQLVPSLARAHRILVLRRQG